MTQHGNRKSQAVVAKDLDMDMAIGSNTATYTEHFSVPRRMRDVDVPL